MVFKHSISLNELRNKAQMTGEITRKLIMKTSDFSIFFSVFMANSKGKDKFLALFQYLFEFFCICGKHSNIPGISELYAKHQLMDMLVYYTLKESISSARKVFRLFRFFDEIKGMVKIIRSEKPVGFKALSVVTYFCSIMYYLSDNILWILSIFVKSKVIDVTQSRLWKDRKNFFSLSRIVAYFLILSYEIWLQKLENDKNIAFLQNQTPESEDIEKENKAYVELIDGRRKNRFVFIQVWLSILRFIMLTKSLKLHGHEYLDPIFVGMCGLISAFFGFFKALFEKKLVILTEKEERKIHSQSRLRPYVSAKDW